MLENTYLLYDNHVSTLLYAWIRESFTYKHIFDDLQAYFRDLQFMRVKKVKQWFYV